MVVDDRIRLNIRQRLEPLIGVEEADALVNHALSPTLQDLVTRADMTLLRTELKTEMAVLDAKLGMVEKRLRGEFRDVVLTQTRWIVGFMMGWSSVVLAAAAWLFR
jgi:hypothetical protein